MPSKSSPSKLRKQRTKTRVLRLDITLRIPQRKGASDEEKAQNRAKVIRELIARVKRGDHTLPKGIEGTIRWQNPPGPMKDGPWTNVLDESAGSAGFNSAVIGYLEGKL